MPTVEDLFREAGPSREAFGNPMRGALQTLVMHNTHDGWICQVQYWFVARWNETHDSDPTSCLAKALALKPNLAPLPASVPLRLRESIAERCGELIDEPHIIATGLDDLLV